MNKSATNTYNFTGNLVAVSQLATCGPALSAERKKAGKNAPTPIPTYHTEKGRVMYMPGAGFRSKLRGAATAIILEATQARGAKKFSLLDAQLNRVGGIKQGGSEPAIDTREYLKMISANPILGIFGASTPWVKGKAMIGHLSCKNPNLDPMVIDGVRADIIRRDPAIVQYLDDNAQAEYDSNTARMKIYSALKAQVKELKQLEFKVKGEEKKAIAAQIKAIEKRVKDDDLKEVSAQLPLDGYEAIPPGAELEQSIRLVGVSQIELGCFLAALQRFAENPVIGAHGAHGAGVIGGSWAVSKTREGAMGTVSIEPFAGLEMVNTEMQEAVQAFYDFIATDDCIPFMNLAALMNAAVEEEAEANE